ncbi:hypothetical protein YC2023_041009 [Brassica napus]
MKNWDQYKGTMGFTVGGIILSGISSIIYSKIQGIPVAAPTFESIGDAIGRTVDVNLKHSRVQVVVDAFKEICFETSVDFKGGEFYDDEEARLVEIREALWLLLSMF